MARPRKALTKEQMQQLEALAAVLTQEQIADYFGIGRTTFHEMMKRDPKVSEHYKKGKAKAIVNVSGNLINQAKSGNTAAAIFYLKTQAGWREQDTTEQHQAQSIQKVQIEVIGKDAN